MSCEAAATNDNWAIVEGYGTLLARHGEGVNVQLCASVSRIDQGRALSPHGPVRDRRRPDHHHRRRDGLIFDPPLPQKRDTATTLPLGPADKVFLGVDGPEWPDNSHLLGDPSSSCTASHRLSGQGVPVIESLLDGECAELLERDSEGAAADLAIGELVALLSSDWRRRLTPIVATRWRAHPHIHGSYSHAFVDAALERSVLTESVDGSGFWRVRPARRRPFRRPMARTRPPSLKPMR